MKTNFMDITAKIIAEIRTLTYVDKFDAVFLKELLKDELIKYYDDGYDVGHSDGHSKGYDVGHSDGHYVGHYEGYELGHSDGYELGQSDGYSEGYSDGRSEVKL